MSFDISRGRDWNDDALSEKNLPERQLRESFIACTEINPGRKIVLLGRPSSTFYFQVPLIVLGVFGANLPSLLQ